MKNISYIELNQKALEKNINYLRKRIGKKVKLASVIKGNAYGHGIKQFLPMAEKYGIDYFAVAEPWEVEEALKVKKDSTDLMLMGMVMAKDIHFLINNKISFYIYDPEILKATINAATDTEAKAKIHLELETGLNRTGLEYSELDEVIELIHRNKDKLEIEGICTHYAGAESVSNYLRVHRQMSRFDNYVNILQKEGIAANYVHSASSAATLLYKNTHQDMVRVGIAQYGFWPGKEVKMNNLLSKETAFSRDPLKQVISWKSYVMTTKTIEIGKFVGYGNSYQATKPTKVGIIPLGYAKGYKRNLSNKGHVLIKGRKCPVLGRVNMSNFTVDISHIKNVKKGDEVVLIGKQKNNKISVASFTERTNYMNYELLSSLSYEIPRYVVNR